MATKKSGASSFVETHHRLTICPDLVYHPLVSQAAPILWSLPKLFPTVLGHFTIRRHCFHCNASVDSLTFSDLYQFSTSLWILDTGCETKWTSRHFAHNTKVGQVAFTPQNEATISSCCYVTLEWGVCIPVLMSLFLGLLFMLTSDLCILWL